MTERDLENPESLHLLLPFYVNGSLDDAERHSVETYLENNPAARTEVVFLQRLRDEVRQTDQGSLGAFGQKRLEKEIAQTRSRPAVTSTRWRAIAAAAALLAVIQGGLLFNIWQSDDGYKMLGVGGSAGVEVIFNETATEAEIRSLLNEVGATIRSGPGALGVYRIELEHSLENADINKVIEKLRENSAIVSEANLD
ncbi:MAG: hypothetical protein DHS20C01_25430 [marine bacterium B5-7]|nr:MAG: hypothetical protein DHS20C01_25430 [marine bacterium B5-7]